jgi:hypothetical protein
MRSRHQTVMDEIGAKVVQNPALQAAVQRELLRLQLAQQIAEAHKRAGLSQLSWPRRPRPTFGPSSGV